MSARLGRLVGCPIDEREEIGKREGKREKVGGKREKIGEKE